MADETQSYAILGLGKFGMALATELVRNHQDVLVADANEHVINEIAHVVTRAVIADATDENELRDLDIGSFDHVYVTLGKNVECSIMATMLAKQLGAKDVTARANNHNHSMVLQKIGADHVVQPEQDLARQMVFRQLHPNVVNYVQITKDITLAEVSVDNPKFYNKTLGDLSFRNKFHVNVIAIVDQNDEHLNQVPRATDVIHPHDQITVIGNSEAIQKVNDELSQEDK